MSCRTIQRRLREADIKKRRAAQRPLLEPEIAAKRLAWAIANKDWKEEQWLKVNWSDECSVEKSSGAKPTWVFCTPGDKWKRDCIAPKKKSGAVSQMVWACFAGGEKGPMVDMIGDPEAKRGGVTGKVYLHVLRNYLPEFYQNDWAFMQDNALIHTYGPVKQLFASTGYEVME